VFPDTATVFSGLPVHPTWLQNGIEAEKTMGRMLLRYWLLYFWKDQRGQDFIEYSLLAAAIVIVVAGFLPQNVMPAVSSIFSKITSSLAIS
jgi:Flp pilus assembly pilin Flp